MKSSRARKSNLPGFTLLEMLAALVVLGFLLAGIEQGRDFGLRAWTAQARTVNEHADLDAANRTLRSLVAHMDPGSVDRPPLVSGGPSHIAFTTELPEQVFGTATRHVDVLLLVDAAHRLVMRWAPHVYAGSGAPFGSSAAVLLDGVRSVSFSYLFPPRSGGSGWADSWSEQYLPQRVRIHLEFPPATARRWPDIVAEPIEGRPRG